MTYVNPSFASVFDLLTVANNYTGGVWILLIMVVIFIVVYFNAYKFISTDTANSFVVASFFTMIAGTLFASSSPALISPEFALVPVALFLSSIVVLKLRA